MKILKIESLKDNAKTTTNSAGELVSQKIKRFTEDPAV
jgi:hypothetical protein